MNRRAPSAGTLLLMVFVVWFAGFDIAGKLLNNWSQSIGNEGRFVQAEWAARTATAFKFMRSGPSSRSMAISVQSLSGSLMGQGRFTEAAKEAKRAFKIMSDKRGAHHPETLMMQNFYGLMLTYAGEYEEAEAVLREALDLRRMMALEEVIPTTLGNLAMNLARQGRYAEAEEFAREAYDRNSQAGGSVLGEGFQDGDFRTIHIDNLAAILIALGRFQEAEALLRQELEDVKAWAGRGGRTEASGYGSYLIWLARVASSQGRTEEAGRLLAEASEQFAKGEPDNFLLARTRALQAENLLSLGDSVSAEPIARSAVVSLDKRFGKASPQSSEEVLLLARVLAKNRNLREAAAYYRRVVAVLERSMPGAHPDVAVAKVELARIALQEGDPEGALVLAEEALAMQRQLVDGQSLAVSTLTRQGAEQRRRAAASTFLRAAWNASEQRPDRAVALRDRAFVAAQSLSPSAVSRAHAVAIASSGALDLAVQLAVANWRTKVGRAESIDSALRAINASDVSASSEIRRLGGERRTLAGEIQAAEMELRRLAPGFLDLVAANTVTVEQVQQALDLDEVLLLLTPGDPSLPEGHRAGFVFAVTREAASWTTIGAEPTPLSLEIADLHANLSPGPQRPFVRLRAHELYQALFGDDSVRNLATGKARWTIAASGSLLSLPFATLVMTPPEGADDDLEALRATQWLGLKKAMTVAPSVSSIVLERAKSPSRLGQGPGFFGVGDPVFAASPGSASGDGVDESTAPARATEVFAGGARNLSALRRLPPLPGSRREIEELARILGARRDSYLLGEEATEAEVSARSDRGELLGASVVAFATHGILAGVLDNAEASLVLTLPVSESDADDGLLSASDAAQLRLAADWVLLSACDTAAGGAPDAEGLTGLARAFFFAGARSVLASQWQVNDKSAVRLTTRAILALRTGEARNASEALRLSMQELATDANDSGRMVHPHYWAPFIVASGL